MVAVGIIRCVIKRQWLGLVIAQVAILFVFVDANTYNLLGRFYALSFPWALWYRLIDTSYWTLLPLAAIGLEGMGSSLVVLQRMRGRFYVALVSLLVLVFGLGVPLYVSASVLTAYNRASRVVAPADLGSIAWLARHAPQSVVVNEEDAVDQDNVPIDAGLWMPDLGGPQPTFWTSNAGPGPLADRAYVLRTIAQDPLPRRTMTYIRRYHVQYVFYSAGMRLGSRERRLNLQHLLHDPLLKMAYVSIPSCTAEASWSTRACNTASYVFRLATTDR